MSVATIPKLDDPTAMTMELTELEPFPAERSGGTPLRNRHRALWQNADQTIEMGVWEVDAGRFHADFGAYGEVLHIICGELDCEGDDGSQFTLRPGDVMVFPRGWTGWWSMQTPVRKIYTLWKHD